MKRVLVLSPHPDDEAIGCGGTLRRHVVEGDEVRVVFLSSGERGGHGRPAARTRRLREGEARRAARVLGIRQLEFWGEPDGALRANPAAVARLRRTLRQFRPHRLYVTHPGEQHPDHQAAARLVQRALRGRALPAAAKPEVLLYEVWTPLQQLDEIIDITPYLQAKLRAVRAHKSQCAVVGFDDAVAGLNRYRGELHCWPEGDYAEAFARLPT